MSQCAYATGAGETRSIHWRIRWRADMARPSFLRYLYVWPGADRGVGTGIGPTSDPSRRIIPMTTTTTSLSNELIYYGRPSRIDGDFDFRLGAEGSHGGHAQG